MLQKSAKIENIEKKKFNQREESIKRWRLDL